MLARMRCRSAVASSFAACLCAQAPDPAWVQQQLDTLLPLYRALHQQPELSFHERATAARLADELEHAGLQVTRDVGGLGVVAVLANGGGATGGAVGLLRCDMDALPIAEQTGLPFASAVKAAAADGQPIGVMHACGHDVHMAVLVGTARWFAAHQDAWRGTLVFVCQPAEERAGGMRAMLQAGLLTRFSKPQWALALHCDPTLPCGTVGVRGGAVMASVDSVDVTFFGKGGHGALPHLTIDPIVLAAQFIVDAQTIVSREIDPVEPCVLTVGSIHGGSKHNIVPDRCDLQITIRAYNDAVREQLKSGIVRKAEALAVGARAPKPKVEFSEPSVALRNDEAVAQAVAAALRQALGEPQVVTMTPQMVAEDFGQLGAAGIPICMFRLGTILPERLAKLQQENAVPVLHTATYWPDSKESIATGVQAMVAAARALLAK
jgi:hippurate hydrolase